MIYITGDTHGDYSRFEDLAQKGLSHRDTLIVLGDFGFLFRDDAKERETLDKMAQVGYTVCFIDGNHENFHALAALPKEEWNGGTVHRVRGNIFHLTRGQVFSIEGKRFFTMGGAYSTDRCMRHLNESYWDEEIPSNEEYKEASLNLEKAGFRLDCILSHTAPRKIITQLGHGFDLHDAELTGYLEWVMHEAEYRKWYFGHFHTDRAVTDRFRAVYLDCFPLE